MSEQHDMTTLEGREQREIDLIKRGAWFIVAVIAALATYLAYLMFTTP